MGFYVGAGGGYYEGDRLGMDDEAVDRRPSPGHVLEGGVWVPGQAPVPQLVTMRQARLALFQAGLLNQVDAAINAMSSPQKEAARIEWDYSSTVERRRPITLAMVEALGMSEADADDLFQFAATL